MASDYGHIKQPQLENEFVAVVLSRVSGKTDSRRSVTDHTSVQTFFASLAIRPVLFLCNAALARGGAIGSLCAWSIMDVARLSCGALLLTRLRCRVTIGTCFTVGRLFATFADQSQFLACMRRWRAVQTIGVVANRE
jgi:hypothetical protein